MILDIVQQLQAASVRFLREYDGGNCRACNTKKIDWHLTLLGEAKVPTSFRHARLTKRPLATTFYWSDNEQTRYKIADMAILGKLDVLVAVYLTVRNRDETSLFTAVSISKEILLGN